MDYPIIKTMVPKMGVHGADLEKLVGVAAFSAADDPQVYIDIVNTKGY